MDEGVGSPSFQEYYWVLILILLIIIGLAVAVFWYIRYCRRLPSHEYTYLEDDALLQNRMEMERKLHMDADRNMAMLYCQYYLRDSNRYILIQQKFNVGSRPGKCWFLVKDTATKTERLLTMTSVSENCSVRYSSANRPALLELLSALQHPYIYPVLDIDRKMIMEQEFIITVVPHNENGTLKDFIYSKGPSREKWKDNYHYGGIHQSQTQRLGCQVLEALLYLKDQKFPPFVHLHSGNVILQNGVARISGLENLLLGYTSYSFSIIPRKLQDNKEAVEVICFGHLIFEMAAGYKLLSSHPTETNYNDLDKQPQTADVLRFIFEHRQSFPSLREVANLEFFRHIDLRELQSHVPMYAFRNKLSPEARSLMREIRRHQKPKKRNKRSQSMSTIETASVDSRDSSGSSWTAKKKKKKRVLTPSETTPDQLCTQMRTMPLPDIEGSISIASLPSSDSGESNAQPLTTNELKEAQKPNLHSQMMQELHAGFRLKHVYDNQNPEA